ncbi:phospholipase B-like 1 isoform X2 [Nematostella vectensis]|uniref:phospholipase B-like 1 isoform X2 n=1 Tax=Nematostella vectensis TaxID=45351 RepID=UPI00138FC132|nr:phospholipase B-like 1 isoform X2 [Nematostella vectensis]
MTLIRNSVMITVTFVLILFVFGCHGSQKSATVYYNRGQGWYELNIVSGTGIEPYNDDVIMHAAGYLEGALTASQINDNYANLYGVFFKSEDDPMVAKVEKFFIEQDIWMRKMIALKSSNSSFWRQMGNIIAQFDGLVEGYQKYPATDKALGVFAFQMLNGVGDLLDLTKALMPERMADWDHMTEKEILEKVAMDGHCSALIKVLPAYENVFASHVSWFTYSAMLRVYKHYHLNLKDETTAAQRMSFSSYPGFLESLDDFYIMDSKLVMLQTTNNVFNKSLYEQVVPESLFSWQRVRLANLVASSGRQWADIVGQYNSGTYNNQYMVLDLKLIQLNNTIQDNALWVVEQIPTLVASGDQTAILRAGYWPSYNVPFYELVYNLSGYPDFVARHGVQFSHELAPRAKIFRRDQSMVHDLDSMKHIMRYNDFQHDPYSQGNPMNAICSRGDLIADGPRASGCYDGKVTDFTMAQSLISHAINGPTHEQQVPFHWSQYQFKNKHEGQPDLFNFDFVEMKPKF